MYAVTRLVLERSARARILRGSVSPRMATTTQADAPWAITKRNAPTMWSSTIHWYMGTPPATPPLRRSVGFYPCREARSGAPAPLWRLLPGLDRGRDGVRAPARPGQGAAVAGDREVAGDRFEPDRSGRPVVHHGRDSGRPELDEPHPGALP